MSTPVRDIVEMMATGLALAGWRGQQITMQWPGEMLDRLISEMTEQRVYIPDYDALKLRFANGTIRLERAR